MRPSSEKVFSLKGSPTLSTPARSSGPIVANSDVLSLAIAATIAAFRAAGSSSRSPSGAANTRLSTPPCSAANSASIRSVAFCVSEPGIVNSSFRLPPTVATRRMSPAMIPTQAIITRHGWFAQRRIQPASAPVESRSCAARRSCCSDMLETPSDRYGYDPYALRNSSDGGTWDNACTAETLPTTAEPPSGGMNVG